MGSGSALKSKNQSYKNSSISLSFLRKIKNKEFSLCLLPLLPLQEHDVEFFGVTSTTSRF